MIVRNLQYGACNPFARSLKNRIVPTRSEKPHAEKKGNEGGQARESPKSLEGRGEGCCQASAQGGGAEVPFGSCAQSFPQSVTEVQVGAQG
jgi:hypothetical protein